MQSVFEKNIVNARALNYHIKLVYIIGKWVWASSLHRVIKLASTSFGKFGDEAWNITAVHDTIIYVLYFSNIHE